MQYNNVMQWMQCSECNVMNTMYWIQCNECNVMNAM